MGGDHGASDGALLLVLEEQLRRERERIEARLRDLDEAADLLTSATSRSLGAHDTRSEDLSGSVAPSVVNRLLTESRGMVRNFVLTVDQGPALDEATVRANRERMERGDTQRAIYPAEVLTTVASFDAFADVIFRIASSSVITFSSRTYRPNTRGNVP